MVHVFQEVSGFGANFHSEPQFQVTEPDPVWWLQQRRGDEGGEAAEQGGAGAAPGAAAALGPRLPLAPGGPRGRRPPRPPRAAQQKARAPPHWRMREASAPSRMPGVMPVEERRQGCRRSTTLLSQWCDRNSLLREHAPFLCTNCHAPAQHGHTARVLAI